MMRNKLLGGFAALALTAVAVPHGAFAGNEDRARAAIAEAKAKIETGDKLGASDSAADIQGRARVALADAERQLKDDDEDRTFHAAKEATALAELAIATAEFNKLKAERDQLAAR
jgi:hypothetical protein